MQYDFEWDTQKAKTNLSKHRISFERATTVFRDPNAISILEVCNIVGNIHEKRI